MTGGKWIGNHQSCLSHKANLLTRMQFGEAKLFLHPENKQFKICKLLCLSQESPFTMIFKDISMQSLTSPERKKPEQSIRQVSAHILWSEQPITLSAVRSRKICQSRSLYIEASLPTEEIKSQLWAESFRRNINGFKNVCTEGSRCHGRGEIRP